MPEIAHMWRQLDKRTGRWYRKWRYVGDRKQYAQYEHRWVWEQANGPIPDGYEIHHRDFNPANNELSNLELVTSEWHNNYHQRLREKHRINEQGIEERWCQ